MASSSSTFSSSRPAACRTDSNRRCSRRRLESVRQAAVVREHVAYRGCLVLLEVCHKPKTFQVEPDFSRLKSSTLDLSYAKDVAGDTPAPLRDRGGTVSDSTRRRVHEGASRPLRLPLFLNLGFGFGVRDSMGV